MTCICQYLDHNLPTTSNPRTYDFQQTIKLYVELLRSKYVAVKDALAVCSWLAEAQYYYGLQDEVANADFSSERSGTTELLLRALHREDRVEDPTFDPNRQMILDNIMVFGSPEEMRQRAEQKAEENEEDVRWSLQANERMWRSYALISAVRYIGEAYAIGPDDLAGLKQRFVMFNLRQSDQKMILKEFAQDRAANRSTPFGTARY